MPAVMRACAAAEAAGVPAIAIGGAGFEQMGRAVAKGLGIPHVPIISYPGPILADDPETFRQRSDQVADEVLRALVGADDGDAAAPVAQEEIEPAYEPTAIVATGTLDEITEDFLRRSWSDGLPIVPPTTERVQAFLAMTKRDPAEVIAVMPPSQREATVYNVAVNGVMAGCRPEYFPVLLAVVEAVGDPVFRLEDAGSTPGWEPLITISGPLVAELDFNTGAGAMRVGRQANTSIGRFLRLFLRNVPGFLIPPGSTDQGAIAYTFNVALAENEDAVQDIGWLPYRVDRGYDAADTVVTVRSVVTISAPIYSGGHCAVDHLNTIAQLFRDAIGPWFYLALQTGRWHPLLVMSPYVARVIAADGFGRDEVRQYLFAHVKIRVGDLDDYSWQAGTTDFSRARLAQDGSVPEIYADDGDPDRLVPLFLRPEWIDIVVAGNPARNQSRAYVGNHGQGVPVTRVVEAAS